MTKTNKVTNKNNPRIMNSNGNAKTSTPCRSNTNSVALQRLVIS